MRRVFDSLIHLRKTHSTPCALRARISSSSYGHSVGGIRGRRRYLRVETGRIGASEWTTQTCRALLTSYCRGYTASTTPDNIQVKGHKMRLHKFLSKAGVASRRNAEELVREGKVYVNDQNAKKRDIEFVEPGDLVRIKGTVYSVSNVLDERESDPKVWLAHKVRGELVTTDDPLGRPTMFDRFTLMGVPHKHLVPVGRLDFNSEGLMLFTNCGDFARELEHPSSRVPREYVVRVAGNIQTSWLRSLKRGIRVENTRYRPIDAEVLNSNAKGAWLSMTLTEGKNREIRRIMKHMHLHVKQLIRVSYGPYQLGDLPAGAFMEVQYRPFSTSKR